jgi:hypothetical protein
VAEGARLESVYTGNRIVGSNPTPSATLRREEPETNILRWCRLVARKRDGCLNLSTRRDDRWFAQRVSPFAWEIRQ